MSDPATPASENSKSRAGPARDVLDQLVVDLRAGQFQRVYDRASALSHTAPGNVALANLIGASARALGRLNDAEMAFRKATQINPASPDGFFNLALVLRDKGDDSGAIKAYREVLTRNPDHAQALCNLGGALTRKGALKEAISHLERARSLQPQSVEVHHSLGNALRGSGQLEQSIKAYQNALSVKPGYLRSQFNIGLVQQEMGDLEQARRAYESALRISPDHELARHQLSYLLAQQCAWDDLDAQADKIAQLGVTTDGVPPFSLLAYEDAPQKQLARSRNWGARQMPMAPLPMPAAPKQRPDRLKIAIFGADFHDHPGMHLMAGMLGAFDRSRFEIHAVSYGEQREDTYRQIARERCDHFHDVFAKSDADILALNRSIEPHIAFDRKGYTMGGRTELFAQRLAPVQVNYIAYPGTLASDHIDYMVVDPITAPASNRADFAERLIRLPHCYAPTNDRRTIATERSSRADNGLPDDAFVLCCMNANYKITRREFGIWMRLLSKMDNSVLWLYRSNRFAQENLKAEAARHSIDPQRLIFASRLPSPQHLERHRHADLGVDTFAFNAHTTTADALWAGLPCVTRIGDQFAARVAASMLHSIGLDELITRSDAHYEALILDLAQDPRRLADIKARLAANRLSAPLFDTQQYTRHLEAGLSAAYERFLSGQPPADIDVAAH